MSILVDTSAWIEALRSDGDSNTKAQVKHALLAGEAVTCALVLLELWNGAGGEHERRQIARLSNDLPSLDVDREVWELSWKIARVCRSRGLTIPVTGVLIISVAEYHGAELLHKDSHFDHYLASRE